MQSTQAGCSRRRDRRTRSAGRWNPPWPDEIERHSSASCLALVRAHPAVRAVHGEAVVSLLIHQVAAEQHPQRAAGELQGDDAQVFHVDRRAARHRGHR